MDPEDRVNKSRFKAYELGFLHKWMSPAWSLINQLRMGHSHPLDNIVSEAPTNHSNMRLLGGTSRESACPDDFYRNILGAQ